jgi:hypothetical protein
MTGKPSSLRIFKPHIRMLKALRKSPNENRFNYCTLAGNQEAGRRNKVDGPLTSRPARESDSEPRYRSRLRPVLGLWRSEKSRGISTLTS